jgi:hypothetical protein
MTRRGHRALGDARGAFLADFGRTEGRVPGFRLFTDRLELRSDGGQGPGRRVVPLARIARAQVVADGDSVVLRIDGLDTDLEVDMVSAWEATLAAELIAGLREMSGARSGEAFDPGTAPPGLARPGRRRSAARRGTPRAGRPLALALDMEG